jgi:plasmid stabilization system protein ParE
MRIRLSRQASNFVRKETKYLNDRSPSAAEKFLNSIKEAKKTLLQFPKIGNGAHGLHIKDALTFVVGDYLLDYIPDVEFVDIINIRHGRMLQNTPEVSSDNEFDDEDAISPPSPK